MSSHIVKVDNADPRLIYRNVEQPGPYHGRGWTSLNGASEDPDKQGPIYENTLQVGPLLDISVEFPFEGIGVSVYGSIRPPTAYYAPLPESKYSVIGYDYAGIPAMDPYVASNVTSPVNNVNFWSRTGMPYKNYTLTINVTAATSNMPYYLDYIAIEVPGADPSSSATSASSTAPGTSAPASDTSSTPSQPTASSTSPPASGTSSTPLSTSASASGQSSDTASSASTASGTASGSSSSTSTSTYIFDLPASAGAVLAASKSVPKGAIIGASIGGAAVLAALVLALLFWYKRRPKAPPEYDYGSVAQQGPQTSLLPLTVTATHAYGAPVDVPPHIIPYVNPDQAAAMAQTGDRGLMFVPSLPPTSPSSASGSHPPPAATLPSQKALAMEMARQSSVDITTSGAGGSSTLGSDRKDGSAYQSSSSRPHTPGPSSEAGSSSAPSTAGAPGYGAPPATGLGHVFEDEESPPAYSAS